MAFCEFVCAFWGSAEHQSSVLEHSRRKPAPGTLMNVHTHRLQTLAQQPNARVHLLHDSRVRPRGAGAGAEVIEIVHFAQHVHSLGEQAAARHALQQRLVGLRVGLYVDVLHAAEDVQRRRVAAVGDARTHETGVDVRVDGEVVLDRKPADEVKHLVELPAAPVHLDEDRESEVGGRNAVEPHLLPELLAEPQTPALHAALQQTVVQDPVGLDAALVHDAEQLKGLVHVALHTVALDDGGKGDEVGLDLVDHHLLKERGGSLHVADARAGVNDGVVRHGVARNALGDHHAVDAHGLAELPVLAEALDESCVHDGVGLHVALLLHFLKQGHGLVHAIVVHVCVQHDAVCDLVGLAAAVRRHLLPDLLALGNAAAAAQRLDDDAARLQLGLETHAAEPIDEPDEALGVLKAEAAVERHGEGALVEVQALAEGDELVHLGA
ncbi:transcriptional Crp Fnr family protein, putative [Babesia caballi]|uniref:Transcriptional Crp Fnr family protein, putative n=1 Tax=Babesia caballi TaxID=5871 RepID=A0AAV4LYN8_BABCB|nr:transcriptional Crp Fnr family protein, putative [Babesia caballi]